MTQLSLFDEPAPLMQAPPPPEEEYVPLEDYGLDAPQQEAFVPKVLQPAPPAPYRLVAATCEGRVQPVRFVRFVHEDGSRSIAAERKCGMCSDFWEPIAMLTIDLGDPYQNGTLAFVDHRFIPDDFLRWLLAEKLVVPTTYTKERDGVTFTLCDLSALHGAIDNPNVNVPSGQGNMKEDGR